MHGSAFPLFVASAPGLEPVVLWELKRLGLQGRVKPGGVALHSSLEGVYRTLLGVGTGLRVALRIARFPASHFAPLEHALRQVPWARFLPRAASLRVRASASKSKLYHTGAIVERIQSVLSELLDARCGGEEGAILLQARLERDLCTLSLDLCGEPLFKRGYRLQTAKAPLREDLARALLLLAGYRGGQAVVDPVCGSGTLILEAAQLALGRPPGVKRSFAVGALPFHDATLFERVREGLSGAAWPASRPPLWGSDRDAGAIAAACANAARAELGDHARFTCQALSAVRLPEGPGLIVANPPYGRRLGDRRRLRDLYAALGALRRRAPDGYRLALVTAEPELARATGIALQSAVMTDAGGLKIRFYFEALSPLNGD